MPSSSLKKTLLQFTWINFTLYDSKNYIIQLKQILKYVNVQNLYKKETPKKKNKEKKRVIFGFQHTFSSKIQSGPITSSIYVIYLLLLLLPS